MMLLYCFTRVMLDNWGLITQVDHPLYEFYGYNYQGVIMNEEELASAAKYPGIGIGYGKNMKMLIMMERLTQRIIIHWGKILLNLFGV